MREVKYRAWSIQEKKMYQVEAIDMRFEQVTVTKKNEYGQEYEAFFKFDDIVLMQYTGIKDGNGNEFCEDDAVEYCDGENGDMKGVIRFIEGSFVIADSTISEADFDPEYDIVSLYDISITARSNITIVGNIHEQPELLYSED